MVGDMVELVESGFRLPRGETKRANLSDKRSELVHR
jgi:hypothetical protein